LDGIQICTFLWYRNPSFTVIGWTFLLEPQEDGQCFCTWIVQAIQDQDDKLATNTEQCKLRCSINDDQFEEILSYNEILNYVKQLNNPGTKLWQFQHITRHKGPLLPMDPNYKGSKFNVTIKWENGEITSKPLSVIAADNPVTCAIYARDNGLLNMDRWKWFKCLAKPDKKLLHMVNQAKLWSYWMAPCYKYRYEVAWDYHHTVALDLQNGNAKWQDSTTLKMEQLHKYQTFKDLGKSGTTPASFKRIRVHL